MASSWDAQVNEPRLMLNLESRDASNGPSHLLLDLSIGDLDKFIRALEELSTVSNDGHAMPARSPVE